MRAGNRVLAALVAAVLAAAGVIALVEIIVAAGGHGPALVDWPAWSARLGDWSWSSGAVRLVGVCVVLVGVGVLFLCARLGARPRFRTRPTTPGAAVFVSRRALARALRQSALAVDGVSAASARVRRRRAVVRARLRPRTSTGAVVEVRARLARRVESFDLLRPPRLMLTTSSERLGRRSGHGLVAPPVAPSPSSVSPSLSSVSTSTSPVSVSSLPTSNSPVSPEPASAAARTVPGAWRASPAAAAPGTKREIGTARSGTPGGRR
ncbi:hypothetical protein BBK14_00335 [Parafrankia soli]|uniref:DUF6286 domain-containing protein n=1 Tax=Parafrankia soli TaxID=2599596 RepID=A0A1S1RIY0_9ACTN|nr:DUF6286 domain-containing protein [Parafrankia soli]OHV46768.1 hypothetical protein BBK14_00335 [Parafrankia soli]